MRLTGGERIILHEVRDPCVYGRCSRKDYMKS